MRLYTKKAINVFTVAQIALIDCPVLDKQIVCDSLISDFLIICFKTTRYGCLWFSGWAPGVP
jgi:hypothetical protein